MTLQEQMIQIAQQARKASHALAALPSDGKNQCLEAMAAALEVNGPQLLQANQADMKTGAELGLSPALLDRLRLDEKRIQAMAAGLREVAALPDPIGRLLDERVRPNGLKLQKISSPIGVIVIIYESRPNVTADAAGLCFKTGNATILRGGKEALHSNTLIAKTMVEAGRAALPNFPGHAIQVVPTPDREAIPALLSLTEYIDLCMPRGGEGLIRAVADCSKVPVIKHYKGVCHVYVDGKADLEMAHEIALNAKTQRPGVCNAMETLLVDESVADDFLPRIARSFSQQHVRMKLDPAAEGILKQHPDPNRQTERLAPGDWSREYNDLIVNIGLVKGLPEAINHINDHGSKHSDSIITADEGRARQFLAAVDSAAVYWNASTRFTDGAQFGMGAEIGISTDKIGARGPMGLEELTSYKWIGIGTGQIRT